jgi:hypothetical protein
MRREMTYAGLARDSSRFANLLRDFERFEVEIPESDYRRLVTLDDIAAYLGRRQGDLSDAPRATSRVADPEREQPGLPDAPGIP